MRSSPSAREADRSASCATPSPTTTATPTATGRTTPAPRRPCRPPSRGGPRGPVPRPRHRTFSPPTTRTSSTTAIWLNGQLQNDFNTKELVLLPGWGERPGGAATVVDRPAPTGGVDGRVQRRPRLDRPAGLSARPIELGGLHHLPRRGHRPAHAATRGSRRLHRLPGGGHQHPSGRGEHRQRLGGRHAPLHRPGGGARLLHRGLERRSSTHRQRFRPGSRGPDLGRARGHIEHPPAGHPAPLGHHRVPGVGGPRPDLLGRRSPLRRGNPSTPGR